VNLLFTLQRLIQSLLGRPEIRWLIALIAVWFAVRVIARMLRQRERDRRWPASSEFDLASLEPRLERLGETGDCPLRVYHLPARLGLVVVAPLGREAAAVDVDAIPNLINQAVPGLGRLYEQSKAKTWVWPVQLSSDGFVHQLQGHVHAGGDDLKGSRWCLVVGRVPHEGRQFMLGLALRTDEPNNMDLITIDLEYKWLDVLRLS